MELAPLLHKCTYLARKGFFPALNIFSSFILILQIYVSTQFPVEAFFFDAKAFFSEKKKLF
jgi:hypothetical protein